MANPIKQTRERHLYLLYVRSGWRIERPSGHEIMRALPTNEAGEKLLIDAGYKQSRDDMNRWDRGDLGL